MAGIIERANDGSRLNAKGRQSVNGDDRLVISMPGGGGLGHPHERDPSEGTRDVLLGFVSPKAAETVYCVAVDENGMIDEARTKNLRAAS